MSIVKSYFLDFLSNIRLTDNQKSDLITGHRTLRKRLEDDEELSQKIVSTFLQGSYRRATAVKPKNGTRADVDVIVVTNLDHITCTPQEALDLFIPFLEKHYKDKYRIQGRSIGISLSYVDLDIVPTAAPSLSEQASLKEFGVKSECSVEEMQDYLIRREVPDVSRLLKETFRFFAKSSDDPEWKSEPLLIPDREAEQWDRTHPLEQIRWTFAKNKECNGYYVNVVKALKWWKKVNMEGVKHPKSYPLEHFIGDCCPDGIQSVAEGVVLTLEKIASSYPTKPYLPDRGVPEHDVFARLSVEDYIAFYKAATNAAILARRAYDAVDMSESVRLWGELFGSEFPAPPENKSTKASGIFTPRTDRTESIPNGRFAKE